MSLRYLFGNVDESGKLQDADDLPEELYEDLNADDGRLDSFLGFSLDLESDDASNTDATSIGEVKANADAEDFAGITNEELDDESFNNTPELPLPIPQPLPQAPSFMLTSSASLATDLDEDYDAMDIDQNGDGSRMHQKHITSEPSAGVAPAIAETPAAPVYTRARLAELFPGFEEGDIKFTDVFSTKPSRISRPQRKLGSLKGASWPQSSICLVSFLYPNLFCCFVINFTVPYVMLNQHQYASNLIQSPGMTESFFDSVFHRNHFRVPPYLQCRDVNQVPRPRRQRLVYAIIIASCGSDE